MFVFSCWSRISLKTTAYFGSSDLSREGSVACIVSPEYEQSLSADGQLGRVAVKFEALLQWRMSWEEMGKRVLCRACQMGLRKYFQVIYLLYENCRCIISMCADYPQRINQRIWYLSIFVFRFLKLVYCNFWCLILLCNIHKSIKLLFSMCVQRQLHVLTSE